jgi:hypothetical protein
MAVTVAVTLLTYSAQRERKAERENAAVYNPDAADIERSCIYATTREQIVHCLRQATDAGREARERQADLRAQQDVAAISIGIFWFTALGFVTSAAGLVALVWTFREQQRLTQHVSRAYVEALEASVDYFADWAITIRVVFFNSGDTPATDVRITGHLRYMPGQLKSQTQAPPDELIPFELHTVSYVGPHLTEYGFGIIPELPALVPLMRLETIQKGNSEGWVTRRNLRIKGEITFLDAFGEERTTPFAGDIGAFIKEGDNEFRGVGRAWERQQKSDEWAKQYRERQKQKAGTKPKPAAAEPKKE